MALWQFLLIIAIALGATGMIVWAIRGVAKDREPWQEEYPRLADAGLDDHPPGDPDRRSVTWSVGALDDCSRCDDVRVHVTLEVIGEPEAHLQAHLAPESAQQLRDAIDRALKDIQETT